MYYFLSSNFNIVDDSEVFLLSQETYLPIKVVKFVGRSPLIHGIKLSFLAISLQTLHQDSDLCPLVLRQQVIIVCVHTRLQKSQLGDLLEERVRLFPRSQIWRVIEHRFGEGPLHVNFVFLLVRFKNWLVYLQELVFSSVWLKVDEFVLNIPDGHEAFHTTHHPVKWTTVRFEWILNSEWRLGELQSLVQVDRVCELVLGHSIYSVFLYDDL